MRNLVVMLVLSALAAMVVVPDSAQAAASNRPVPQLDLERYVGTWHEIAHLPMFFQRHCVDRITANYTRKPDGTVEVRNACATRNGAMDQSVGVARPVPGQPGALEVRFAPRWLSWLPMVWADYWVVDLDPEYRWAVVGGPSRKYLWILSREPRMARATFERITSRAAALGYPVDRLVMAAPVE